mgnify:CR=1 FL=1
MVQITNTTQLSTFSIIKSIILSNATFAAKFKGSNILEFEPKLKSQSFCGFPYIVVNIPDLDDIEEYLGDKVRHKEFEVEITMVMEYIAKDNYASYASNLITVLDSSDSTLKANGYNLVKVTADGTPDLQTVQSKELVVGSFSLLLQGEVAV